MISVIVPFLETCVELFLQNGLSSSLCFLFAFGMIIMQMKAAFSYKYIEILQNSARNITGLMCFDSIEVNQIKIEKKKCIF
jgi:hypothetical protein